MPRTDTDTTGIRSIALMLHIDDSVLRALGALRLRALNLIRYIPFMLRIRFHETECEGSHSLAQSKPDSMKHREDQKRWDSIIFLEMLDAGGLISSSVPSFFFSKHTPSDEAYQIRQTHTHTQTNTHTHTHTRTRTHTYTHIPAT